MRPKPPALPPRRGPFRASPALGLAAGLLLASGTLPAVAQDPGGLRLTFGIDQRFEADTNQRLQVNRAGNSFTSTTLLSAGFISDTRTQRVRFGTTLPIRLLNLPDDSRRFARGRPDLDFSYSRVAPRSDFSASATYRSSDLRFVRPIDLITDILDPIDPVDPIDPIPLPDPADPADPSDPTPPVDPVDPLPPDLGDLPEDEELDDLDLIDGRGTRNQVRLNSQLRVGLGGPVTTTFNLGLLETRYSGDVNPALSDTRRLTFGTFTTLRLTPVTQGTIALSLDRFERDNAAQLRRDTRRISFGINHELTQTLAVNASIGQSWIETEEFGITRERQGIDLGAGANLALPRGSVGFNASTQTTDAGRRSSAALSYNLPMPNGSLTLGASARRTQDGTRTNFTIGRNMDLRRGPLSASLGLSRSQEGNWGTIGRVSYSEELRNGSWRITLLQGFSLDIDDQETRRTLASAGYTHFINNSSRLNLNAAYSSTPRTDNARLSATYSRDLTRDWTMNMGYRFDTRSRDSAGRADSHALFLTLGRGFNIGL